MGKVGRGCYMHLATMNHRISDSGSWTLLERCQMHSDSPLVHRFAETGCILLSYPTPRLHSCLLPPWEGTIISLTFLLLNNYVTYWCVFIPQPVIFLVERWTWDLQHAQSDEVSTRRWQNRHWGVCTINGSVKSDVKKSLTPPRPRAAVQRINQSAWPRTSV